MSERTGLGLQKFLARTGQWSRRAAQALVLNGRVMLNSQRTRSPAVRVCEGDSVQVDGGPPLQLPPPESHRLWRYHKPPGLITTHSDPKGRPTVFDAVRILGLPRVVSAGRLDVDSEGLLLLTTSGPLSRFFELPASGFRRTYHVLLATGERQITDEMLHTLRSGIELPGGTRFAPMQVEPEPPRAGGRCWVRMVLAEGKKREIRRAWEAYNFPVLQLMRVAYGPFELGRLSPGTVMEVPQREVSPLVAAAAERSEAADDDRCGSPRAHGKEGHG